VPLVKLLSNDDFWTHVYYFLRAMHGPLRILRYCDMKVPIMDKLYYLGCRATTDFHDQLLRLNEWSKLDEANSFLAHLNQVIGMEEPEDCERDEVEFGSGRFADGEEEDSSGDEFDEDFRNDSRSFGYLVKHAWNHRFKAMQNPYVIAGWTLCPHQVVQAHVRSCLDGKTKDVITKLLVKLVVLPNNTHEIDSDDYKRFEASVVTKYWVEWEEFNTRSFRFMSDKACWLSSDIDENRTAQWHKTNSWYETSYLGRFACRVTSKIVGIGNAERCWGDVKTLKDGKRSHLTAEATSRQATIYGTACAEKAQRKMQYKSGEDFTMWDDKDMDALGLDKFGLTVGEIVPTIKKKKFLCWVESWEKKCIQGKDSMGSVQLSSKYGGMKYLEGDDQFTIHNVHMNYLPAKSKRKEWMVVGCKEEYFNQDDPDEDTFDNMEINMDLCGCIWENYRKYPEEDVEIVTRPEDFDKEGEWIWMDDGPGSQKPRAKKTGNNKGTRTSPRKQNNKKRKSTN
jgi:hypothetical protein